MQSSLDGFTTGPDGEFDWPDIGDEAHNHFVTTLRDAGLFAYGRTAFEMMASYWPIADTLPDSTSNPGRLLPDLEADAEGRPLAHADPR
jgi:dihydrofolate reductase